MKMLRSGWGKKVWPTTPDLGATVWRDSSREKEHKGGLKSRKQLEKRKKWKIRKEGLVRWCCHEGNQKSQDHGGKAVPF